MTGSKSIAFEKRMSVLAAAPVVKLRDQARKQDEAKAAEAWHEDLVGKLRIRTPTQKLTTNFVVVDKVKKKKSSSKDESSDGESDSRSTNETQDPVRRSRRLRMMSDASFGDSSDESNHGIRAFGADSTRSDDYSQSHPSSRAESNAGDSEDGDKSLIVRCRECFGKRGFIRRRLRRLYVQYCRMLCGAAPLRRFANGLVAAAILYFLISIPYFLSFVHHSTPAVRTLDHIMTAFYWLDCSLA